MSESKGRKKTLCDDCGGACCKSVAVLIGTMTDDTKRWAETRGTVERNDKGICLWRIPVPCAYLDYEGRCMIYAERPLVCRDFEVGGERCKAARAAEGKKR